MNYQQMMKITQHIKNNEGANPDYSIYGDTTGHFTTGIGINPKPPVLMGDQSQPYVSRTTSMVA